MILAYLTNKIPNTIPQLEAKRLRITLYTLLISFALSFSLEAFFVFKDIAPLNLIFGFFTAVYGVNWFIFNRGFYSLAKTVLYFSLLLQVLGMSFSLASTINIKIFYMPIAIVPFLIFGKKERVLFSIAVFSTFINILLIYSIDKLDLGFASEISEDMASLIGKVFNLIALICMLFLAYMFLSLSELGEELLFRNKMILEEQQKELSAKNLELENSKLELERLNDVKDKLLTIISHDLKSPINNIQSFTELMLEEKLSKDDVTTFLLKFKESSFYTHQLLDNLVKWSGSHIISPVAKQKETEVRSLVNLVINQVNDIAQKKNIEVVNAIDDKSIAWIDHHMLEIIFRNLISNAIKFSEVGSKVIVKSGRTEGRIHIKIEDTGMGIPDSMIQNLFKPGLVTTRLGTSFEKGSGIGLLLCKQLVEANNGAIYVSSTPGVKTTFTVDVPCC